MSTTPRPEFVSNIYYQLANNTVSIDKAITNAYAKLGAEYTNDFLTMQDHVTKTLHGKTFAAWYAKHFGRKGHDLHQAKLRWIARCLAASHAELKTLPPPEEEP